ncbi:nitrate reductase [Chimaeribacter californicus]|uniref:Nitrate reductase n=1 Tax=Chimaeribacter californicus TaxID=2060067 RepID=A0A2N5E759_9GAMM|nr:nitrate reductase [Chimaeribacter californicus]PLR37317.1 nitrate reductase [Chimaeribacter californicus]
MTAVNTAAVNTTCPYCGVGCGVRAQVQGEGVTVSGDPQHPANLGRLCIKGSRLGDTLDLSGRLLHPMLGDRCVSWDQALDAAAGGLQQVIRTHGPQAVAFYGSGQLLTEDYYVANKLMKGFIGAGNMDTNSRLCMASAVAGYKRALGADWVPCRYRDLEQTDLVLLVGSNAAWAHPVLYQRLAEAKRQRPQMQVVLIDPRATASADLADRHLALQPGSDIALFNGLLHWLHQHDALDQAFLQQHTTGADAALAAAAGWDLARVSRETGLSPDALTAFFHQVAQAPRMMTLFSMGINQSSAGTDQVNAITNLHLATGRINTPGNGPFSLTGQPNAMGGREVGGLANQLAAHMGFSAEEVDRVGRFWGSDNVTPGPGLNATALFDALADGRIKAVWIMGTNPLVSLPDADRARQALAGCPLVIVSEVMQETDTAALAHIRLPALAWGEKEGTVTNSERTISRQRAFLPPPGEARGDWWIVSQVAQRLGFGAAFAYTHPHQIFCEHAALSGFENQGQRAFDISALATLTQEQYQQLTPQRWPLPALPRQARAFWHADDKARLLVVQPPVLPELTGYPLTLNSGRIRDQWHTMTRTGKAAALMRHTPEPVCVLHPADMADMAEGDIVCVTSPRGWLLARATTDNGQLRGSVFVPMHWNRQFSAQARVNALVEARVDPVSGQPQSKQTPVRVARWPAAWQGELFLRGEGAPPPDVGYWSRVTQPGVSDFILADRTPLAEPEAWLQALCGGGLLLQQAFMGAARHLLGWRDGELQAALYLHPQRLPGLDREAVVAAFRTPPVDAAARRALLAGRAAGEQAPRGAIVCSCFGIGELEIRRALAGGCASVEALGAVLKCGTHCGSCRPELKKLIQQAATQPA